MKFKLLMAMILLMTVGCGKTDTAKETSQPEKVTYMETGQDSLEKGDIATAIQNFDAAIKQDPTNTANYIPLGELYLRTQNYTAAVDTFNAAAKINPADGETQYFLALSSLLKSQLEESRGNATEVEFYRDKALMAGKQSAEIFLQARDEERFKKAVAIVKSLMDEVPAE